VGFGPGSFVLVVVGLAGVALAGVGLTGVGFFAATLVAVLPGFFLIAPGLGAVAFALF
jgi:hypothetical protein